VKAHVGSGADASWCDGHVWPWNRGHHHDAQGREAYDDDLGGTKSLVDGHVLHGEHCAQVASALVSSASRICCTGVPSPALTTYEGGVCPDATGAEVPPLLMPLEDSNRRRASSSRASEMMASSGDGDDGCTLCWTGRSPAEATVAEKRRRRRMVVAAMAREKRGRGSQ
jgi:hypothetical protein